MFLKLSPLNTTNVCDSSNILPPSAHSNEPVITSQTRNKKDDVDEKKTAKKRRWRVLIILAVFLISIFAGCIAVTVHLTGQCSYNICLGL